MAQTINLVVLGNNGATALIEAERTLRQADIQVIQPVLIEPKPQQPWQAWLVKVIVYDMAGSLKVTAESEE